MENSWTPPWLILVNRVLLVQEPNGIISIIRDLLTSCGHYAAKANLLWSDNKVPAANNPCGNGLSPLKRNADHGHIMWMLIKYYIYEEYWDRTQRRSITQCTFLTLKHNQHLHRIIFREYKIATEHDQIQDLPTTAIPVEVQEHHNGKIRIMAGSTSPRYWKHPVPIHSNEDLSVFMAALDPWEAELLEYTHIRSGDTAYALLAKMTKTGFVAASDGSVRHKTNGSFGWIISTQQGERLVHAYGPVRGMDPTSYPARRGTDCYLC
jgi:hypothetical protein